MNLFLATGLSLLIPLVPWIGAAGSWLKDKEGTVWWAAFAATVLLDLWWAKPLGVTAAGLIMVTLVIKWLQRFWPSEKLVFEFLPAILGVILFEIYLYLI